MAKAIVVSHGGNLDSNSSEVIENLADLDWQPSHKKKEMCLMAKSKSVVYSFNIEFLSKTSLSESGRNRLMGVVAELLEKNQELFGEDLKIFGYAIDNGKSATGAWERMNKRKAEDVEDALIEAAMKKMEHDWDWDAEQAAMEELQ